MKIVDNDSYRRALERANRLRNQGKTAEASTELADLEAAIEHYDIHPDRPARSTGRPEPDPYDQEDP